MFKIQRPENMTILFLVLALVSGISVYLIKGPEVWIDAVADAGVLILQVIPIIIAAVLISGYAQTLIPRQVIEKWLGSGSGLKGMTLAAIAGALTPGGPFAAFPLVIAILRAGASFYLTVTYLTSWAVLGLNRALIWEIPFFGIEFVGLKLLVSLPLPFIAGFAAKAMSVRRGEF